MSSFLFFLWHDYQLSSHFTLHKKIVKGKKFKGIILNKKELDKKYMYLVNLYVFESDDYKKQKIDANITIITKKNIRLGEFVFIPFVFFIQKHNSINNLLMNHLNLSSHAFGMAPNIKINTHSNYKKVYELYVFLFTVKENFYNFFKQCLTQESKFFFDTIFLGKSVHNKEFKKLFSIWGYFPLFSAFGIAYSNIHRGINVYFFIFRIFV